MSHALDHPEGQRGTASLTLFSGEWQVADVKGLTPKEAMRCVLCLLLLISGCIRSPAEVEPPGEGGIISGTVAILDADIADAEGRAGIRVAIDELGISVQTNADGRFRLGGVPLGLWRVVLEQRDLNGVIRRARLLDPIEILFDGQTEERGTLLLGDVGVLNGSVSLPPDVTPGGTLVVLSDTAFQAVTDREGRFRFARVPQGTFNVVAFRPGFAPGRIGVQIGPGSIVTARPIALAVGMAQAIDVAGGVLDEDGPAADVEVRLVGLSAPDFDALTRTDADGLYAFQNVPPGLFIVIFTKDGFAPVRLDGAAVLPGAGRALRTIRLRPTIEGDIDGDGIPDEVDDDMDNDGCPDDVDRFALDGLRCGDTDGDGVDDIFDGDDDGDNLTDAEEVSLGVDGFITNPFLRDTDGDGFEDADDLCPTIASAANEPAVCAETFGPMAIDLIRPREGRVDDIVEIVGSGFAVGRSTLVRFGSAGPALEVPAANVDSRVITFTVPRQAASGPLTVVNASRTATSAETFTFFPPPEIINFEPASGQVNEGVVLFGKNFDDAQSVTIGTTRVELQDCDPSIIVPRSQQVLCFRIPVGATSGPISVRTDDGTATSVAEFSVLAGPQITALVPPIAPPGSMLRIQGSGFGNLTSVDVVFGGGARATSDSVADQEIIVTVPSNAATGIVTVEHPAGDATSLDPLFVDNLVPAITDFFPSLAMVGETVTIFGANLDTASQIEFTGGLRAIPQGVPSNGQLDVLVPQGAEPGPMYVHFPNAVTATTPYDLSVLEVSAPVATIPLPTAVSTNGSQTEVRVFGASTTVGIHDPTSLALLRTRQISPGPQIELTRVSRADLAPDGRKMVLRGLSANTSREDLYVVDATSFATEFRCEQVVFINNMLFYRNRAFFHIFTGMGALGQFDLNTGECSVVSEATGGITFDAMNYAGQGRLHLYQRSSGQGVIDIDPLRATFGQYLQSSAGTSPVAGAGWAWFGVNSNFVYGYTSGGLRRVERLSPATNQFVTITNRTPSARPLLSLDRRWMVVGSESAFDFFFDNVRGEVARVAPIGRSDAAVPLSSPSGSRFVIYQTGTSPAGLITVNIRY